MELQFFIAIIGLLLLTVILLIVLIVKKNGTDSRTIINRLENYEKNLKDEFDRSRKANSESDRESRKENTETLVKFQESINGKLDTLTKNTHESLTNN